MIEDLGAIRGSGAIKIGFEAQVLTEHLGGRAEGLNRNPQGSAESEESGKDGCGVEGLGPI